MGSNLTGWLSTGKVTPHSSGALRCVLGKASLPVIMSLPFTLISNCSPGQKQQLNDPGRLEAGGVNLLVCSNQYKAIINLTINNL